MITLFASTLGDGHDFNVTLLLDVPENLDLEQEFDKYLTSLNLEKFENDFNFDDYDKLEVDEIYNNYQEKRTKIRDDNDKKLKAESLKLDRHEYFGCSLERLFALHLAKLGAVLIPYKTLAIDNYNKKLDFIG